jgi:hypothetical protein
LELDTSVQGPRSEQIALAELHEVRVGIVKAVFHEVMGLEDDPGIDLRPIGSQGPGRQGEADTDEEGPDEDADRDEQSG